MRDDDTRRTAVLVIEESPTVQCPVASAVPLGRSPGGKAENTGKASAFNDRLMIGTVDVI
jgi:hypothetical protein